MKDGQLHRGLTRSNPYLATADDLAPPRPTAPAAGGEGGRVRLIAAPSRDAGYRTSSKAIASETPPTATRLDAQTRSRLNQLRDRNRNPSQA